MQRDLPGHAHGTPGRYKAGCRDDGCGCRDAIAAAERRRYRLKAEGRWQDPYTDAAPAREHVQALQAARLGWKQVARLAGVPEATVSRLLYGRAGYPPSLRIRAASAEALLAVRPALDTLPASACTDATGTTRRLQALIVQGRTIISLAGCLGMERSYLGRVAAGKVPGVTVATARKVRDLFEEWWDQPPPEETPRERGSRVPRPGLCLGAGLGGGVGVG